MRCDAWHCIGKTFYTEMARSFFPSIRPSTAVFLKRPRGRIFGKPGVDIGWTFIVTPV